MTERERDRDSGGGALTGATGDLVAPEPADDLVTGERREVESSGQRADVTTSMRGLATGDQGLAEGDPAYWMESHPSASDAATTSGGEARSGTPVAGGDEISEDPERL